MGTGAGSDWRERRLRAANAHAAAHEQRRAAESEQARGLIAEFIRAAAAQGVAPEPLRARPYGGRGRYRTNLQGWYLMPDQSIAVGTDGEFYLLSVAPSLLARFTGTRVQPQPPRLVVGEGGRDGESIPLQTLLQRRLAGTWNES
jgi:hypothetical protein